MIRKMIALLENIGRSWWKREGLQENVPSRLNNGNMEIWKMNNERWITVNTLSAARRIQFFGRRKKIF